MTCSGLYVSEQAPNCIPDPLWGEGCEICYPLFNGNLLLIVMVIILLSVVLAFIVHYFYSRHYYFKHPTYTQPQEEKGASNL